MSSHRTRVGTPVRRTAAMLLTLAVLAGACSSTPDEAPQPEPVEEAPEPAPAEEPSEEAPEPDPAPAPEPDAAGDCSAAGAAIDAPDLSDLPDEVVALRDFLIDAALRCDEQLLHTALTESDMFTYSFGAEGDAIGYWWDLEEAGEEPFLRLAQVLATTPAVADGGEIVVWPQVTTGNDEHTGDDAWAELTWLTSDELAAYRGEVGYLGWRAGISMDGEWRFFVSGD